jgi:hypothetical protein
MSVPCDNLFFFFFCNLCCGTLGTAATTGLLYQPRMIGDGDCEEIGGMKIGRGNRSTRRRKPALAPLCPSDNLNDQDNILTNLTLVQILCSWTLSIVPSLSKNTVLFIFQNAKFRRLDSVSDLK